jgi:SAM-dependent methyltransferase
MNNISHPVGNFKIYLLKFFSEFISRSILFFISFFLKINKKESEIIISQAFYAPWKKDALFKNFFEKIKELTLLDKKRAFTLWYLVKNIRYKPGVILDLGCLKGGAGFLMAKINKKGKVYCYDTFSGFPKFDKFYKKAHFVYDDIDQVTNDAKKFKLRNIKIIKSFFPKNIKEKINLVKLCHIDVNTYSSTRDAFFFINSRMAKDGIIVFDDYGIYGNSNIKKFIYKISKNFHNNYHFFYNFMGQCILIKKT